MWPIPLMGAVAASIPASGAPVAGGIVFLPVLQAFGICPRDAVAYSAATQFFGCGIFAPLNWLVLDPDVFLPGALCIAIVPSAVGLVAGLTASQSLGCHGDQVVLGIFGVFCLALAVHVAHGLARHRLQSTSAPARSATTPDGARGADGAAGQPAIRFDRYTFARWCVPCVLGGWLTAYIGVAIEKVLFVLLTSHAAGRGRVPLRTATVTSITLVGWLSGLAFALHALSPCDPAAAAYIGAVPYKLWLVGLPGVLAGATLGPRLNQLVGARNVLIAFCFMLLFEGAHNLSIVWSAGLSTTCVDRTHGRPALHCTPQRCRAPRLGWLGRVTPHVPRW